MKNFFSFHPFVLIATFCTMLFLTFLSHPLFHIAALLGGMFLYCSQLGFRRFLKSVCYSVPFFLLISITNPIFSHNGKTVLFFLFENRITLESVLNGADIACIILAVSYWSFSYSKGINSEVLIGFFSKVSQKAALILSMSVRFIPLFMRKAKEIYFVQKVQGQKKGVFEQTRLYMSVFSATVTWALENAMMVSQSMNARGYGTEKRSVYQRHTFQASDGGVLIFLSLTVLVLLVVSWMGEFQFFYYPSIVYRSPSIPNHFGFLLSFLFISFPGGATYLHKFSVWKSIRSISDKPERSIECRF
jgi:energy-coupling factor transport system permease protein